MEIINVPRAFGKTTNLIMRAVKTGYPIIVGTSSQKNVLKDQIKRITDKEVEVYTVFEFCDNNKFRGKDKPENVLIDELPIVLSIMLNANVDMATMTSNSTGVKQGIPLASADGRNGEIINKTENI